MSVFNRFRAHPSSVGETYAEHCRFACGFGWTMFRGAVACFVHAACPWLHVTTGSQTVHTLHQRILINRRKQQPDEMSALDPVDSIAENI